MPPTLPQADQPTERSHDRIQIAESVPTHEMSRWLASANAADGADVHEPPRLVPAQPPLLCSICQTAPSLPSTNSCGSHPAPGDAASTSDEATPSTASHVGVKP